MMPNLCCMTGLDLTKGVDRTEAVRRLTERVAHKCEDVEALAYDVSVALDAVASEGAKPGLAILADWRSTVVTVYAIDGPTHSTLPLSDY